LPATRFASIAAHTVFLPPLRDRRPQVLDLGANQGEFATWAAETLNAEVYAVEALPELAASLAANPRFTTLHAAVGGQPGTTLIFRSPTRCASACLNDRNPANGVAVPAVTLGELLERWELHHVDLVKIDVEGSELAILQTTPASVLQSIGQITCEFHDFIDATHRPTIRLICDRMKALGFIVVPMAATTYGDTLFINRKLLRAPLLLRLECVIYKYRAAAGRFIQKILGTKRGH